MRYAWTGVLLWMLAACPSSEERSATPRIQPHEPEPTPALPARPRAGSTCDAARPLPLNTTFDVEWFVDPPDVPSAVGADCDPAVRRYALYRVDVPANATLRMETVDGFGVLSVVRGCGRDALKIAPCDSFGPSYPLGLATREPGTYFVTLGERSPDLGAPPAIARVTTTLETDAARDTRCSSAPALPLGHAVRGNTRGSGDAFHPSCIEYADGLDDVYRVEVVAPSRLTATVGSRDFNALVLSLQSTCEKFERAIACNVGWADDENPRTEARIDAVLQPGEHYLVVGSDYNAGRYTLEAELVGVAP
jgi:hypothetical protein